MATPAPPNSFSNHLEGWVFEKAVSSVVLVELKPDNPKHVLRTMNSVFPFPRDMPAAVIALKKKQRLEDCKHTRCSTGFVLEGAESGQLYVLTCAHTLDHIFNAESPIDPTGINDLFNISILCDHAESNYRKKTASTRKYASALVAQVECSKDMMLLQVEMSEMEEECQEFHQPLRLARQFPNPLQRLVMISWPPFRPRTACVGETSHPGREYSEVMFHAPEAHSIKLSEVNIMGDKGSSGAPLLDGAVDVVGVFHSGGAGALSFSYFIAFDDLRETLIGWGILEGD